MVFTEFRKTLNILITVFVGFFVLGCGGGRNQTDDSAARTVTGTITYTRLPIKVDNNGYPLGLDSQDNAEILPLRGAYVRVVCSKEETMPDDSKVEVWYVYDWDYTNSEGEYTASLPDDDTIPAYVEVQSVFNNYGYLVRIIADPDGINSQIPQADRVIYSMRKGIDGSAPFDNPMPAATVEGKVELDFEIGLDDGWWITHPSEQHAQSAQLEFYGTGSKVAAIIDTLYTASTLIGNPTPGATLDLHYRQNITEPFGTYVEYDRARFPLAYEPSSSTGGGVLHFFGSVRGGPGAENDDAWDQGTLLSMMARNSMRGTQIPGRFQFPPKKYSDISDGRNQSIISSLQPTMAMAEGLPDAIAAIVLKTPFLTSGSGTAVKDIRKITELPQDIYSSPAITAFTWEVALKANSITAPGEPDTWEKIEPNSIPHFYSLQSEIYYDEESEYSEITDLPSLFTQLKRLSEISGSLDSVDLTEIFTDNVITQMATPFFGEIWPRPIEGPLSNFITDWGLDPNSATDALPSFTLSMSDSVADAEGNFSNLTYKENFSAKIRLSKDVAYRLSVIPDPPLPTGASIEVRIDGNVLSSYLFDSSSPDPKRIVLIGDSDYAIAYLLDFSLKSSKVKIAGDTIINVRLDPAY